MYKSFFALVLLQLCSVSAVAIEPRQRRDPSRVSTTSGTLQGHVASWPQNTRVLEFLGIPYAQPPLGQLRFAAPLAYQNTSSAVFVADKYSEDCVQYTGAATTNQSAALAAYGYGMGGGNATNPHTYGEDCLSLNVWTNPTGQQGKAVMLWLYGGAFAAGTSDAPFYDGARLAQEQDVIVVSINYRITIFGFPNAPGLPDENVGLLDQRLAVEWVRDNIAAFGGDPTRITLFGESAGGSSVDYYSYAWTEDPIVNGLILESGTAFILASSNATDYSAWYNISQSLGCGGEEAGASTVACVRGLNATDVINAVGESAASTGGLSTSFGPVADEKVVFSDYKNRSATGQFIKKPYFVGNNDNELGIILALGSGFLGGSLPGNISTSDLITIGSAAEFACPPALAARDRVANGVPTWRYRYMGVWNNTALVPGMGAYHSSEIPFVFGTNGLRPNSTPDTTQEARLATVMMHAWAEFAKAPATGLSNLGWPLYNPNGTSLIRLGYNNQSTPNFGNSTQYDTLCPILGY